MSSNSDYDESSSSSSSESSSDVDTSNIRFNTIPEVNIDLSSDTASEDEAESTTATATAEPSEVEPDSDSEKKQQKRTLPSSKAKRTIPSSKATGGVKVSKKPKYDPLYIQRLIDHELRARIPIDAFKQERIVTQVKNTVGIKCKQCGSENVYVESKQVRSADEAMTKFYTCLDCKFQWRFD